MLLLCSGNDKLLTFPFSNRTITVGFCTLATILLLFKQSLANLRMQIIIASLVAQHLTA